MIAHVEKIAQFLVGGRAVSGDQAADIGEPEPAVHFPVPVVGRHVRQLVRGLSRDVAIGDFDQVAGIQRTVIRQVQVRLHSRVDLSLQGEHVVLVGQGLVPVR
jgi:hypothetical protein